MIHFSSSFVTFVAVFKMNRPVPVDLAPNYGSRHSRDCRPNLGARELSKLTAREGFHPSYAYTYLATRLAHFLATG